MILKKIDLIFSLSININFFISALHDIATDNEIYNATGIDSKKFTQKIIDIQDNATMKLYNLCPKYGNNLDINLFKIGK